MPHASFKIIPGVDQNKTLALNEAAISESQLIRFVPDRTLGGLVQKLGGWAKFYMNTVGSTVRALWAWEDTNANSYLAVGAEGLAPAVVTNATGNGSIVTLTFTGQPNQFSAGSGITVSGINPSAYNGQFTVASFTTNTVSYSSTANAAYVDGGLIQGGGGALQVIEYGGSSDITPQTATYNIPVSISTTAGSNIVTVTHTAINPTNYDVVNFLTHVSVGGIILFGQYQVYLIGANTYQIRPLNIFLEPYLATSTVTNGGVVPLFEITKNSDLVDVTLPDHGFSVGQTFPILVATSLGGITLYGNYIIVDVVDQNIFTISASTQASGIIPVTNVSGNGTVVTVTHTNAATFLVNTNVIMAGVDPAAYDGTYLVSSANAGSFTYLSNVTTSYVANGTATGSFKFYENSGLLRVLYQRGVGPLQQGTGYGIGPYGAGEYGTGIVPVQGVGTPINADDWTFDNWGEILIANPVGGPIYYWDPTSGNPVATALPSAPSNNMGCFVGMPQRQIIAWGSTFTGIIDPLLIRWCDVNNFDVWTALITNQAGSYRIPKGSKIVQCIQGPQQGLIWTDLALWAMQYSGPPYVYQFNEIGTNCGLIGHKAAGTMNGGVFWMGQSQFFKFMGNGVEPVRCPIWDVAFQDLDRDYVDHIRIATNSRFMEVSWFYPTTGSNGENTHYVKYNIILDQWDYGSLARTAWINESVLGPPLAAAPNQYIYQHEVSTDADGEPMVSYFQTGYFVMNEADIKMFIDQVWPDMKWGYFDGPQSANILLTFYVADYPGQTPIAYGPFTLTQATTFVTPRFRGRLVSIRIESSDIGSWWRLGNIRYRYQEDGKY